MRDIYSSEARKKKKGGFIWIFFISLGLLVVVDFFIHKHPYFSWEEWPQFYATYGFVACVVLVLIAKYVLRPIVKRKENYYD